MIILHRLNKQEFVLNADLIETVEATPDTLCTLINGKKLIVRDPVQDVIGKVVAFRQLCNSSIRVVREEQRDASPAADEASVETNAREAGTVKGKK